MMRPFQLLCGKWLSLKQLRKKSTLTLIMLLALVTVVLVLVHVLYRPEAPVDKAIMNGVFLNLSHRITHDYTSNLQNIPLLLLFTTFSPTLTKYNIYENTLQNWAHLRPVVQPVIFYDRDLNKTWKDRLKLLGWALLPVPKQNVYNLPVLRYMFEAAIDMYPAHYYGYANADILFDESLVLTLHALYQHPIIEDFLLVGRRINYPVPEGFLIHSLAEVRQYAARDNAVMFIREAQDYFITTKTSFPWDELPNFVVGRVGYDNWLVSYAIQNGPVVIDATNSVLCLHQTGYDGIFSGSHAKKLPRFNLDLVGYTFDLGLGKTDCAKWVSVFNHEVQSLVIRRRSSKYCYGYQNDYFEHQDIDISGN